MKKYFITLLLLLFISCSTAQVNKMKSLGVVITTTATTAALGGAPLLIGGVAGGSFLFSEYFFIEEEEEKSSPKEPINPTNPLLEPTITDTITNNIIGNTESPSFIDSILKLFIKLSIVIISILTLFYIIKGVFKHRNTIFPTIGVWIKNLSLRLFSKKRKSRKKR